MFNPLPSPLFNPQSISTTELEFLETLLLSDTSYPWNPTDDQAEDYLAGLESEFILDEDCDAAIATGCEKFYHQLDQLWLKTESARPPLEMLQGLLIEKYSQWVPQNWLAEIAASASSLADSSLSMADKLAHCLETLLPNIGWEDLQVLARPFAYAMRGNETPELPQKPWSELSEIEKARVALAISRFALDETQNWSR